MERKPDDIVAPGMTAHDTWTECPVCHRNWKNPTPTPGVLMEYRNCPDCPEQPNLKIVPKTS